MSESSKLQRNRMITQVGEQIAIKIIRALGDIVKFIFDFIRDMIRMALGK